MPDIENRTKREQQVARMVGRAIGKSRDNLLAALGSPPNVANVPDQVWETLEADVEAELKRATAIVMLLGVRGMGESFDFRPDPERSAVLIDRAASRRAASSASSIVDTFRDRVETAATVARDTMVERQSQVAAGEIPPSRWPQMERAIVAELDVEIGRKARTQAEAVGVSEVTAAHTEGEQIGRKQLEKQTEQVVVARWNCEPGACDECRALDGSWEHQWPDKYRDGPPSPHPGCRCWLNYELVA